MNYFYQRNNNNNNNNVFYNNKGVHMCMCVHVWYVGVCIVIYELALIKVGHMYTRLSSI